MIRPCFLVIDREYAGSISTRKLVIETAKLNVITAYSAVEAIETLKRFPAVSGVVMDAGVKDMTCQELVNSLKAIGPKVPVVVIRTPRERVCTGADYYLESFNPASILTLLQKIVPEESAAILKHDKALSVESEEGGSSRG